MHKQLFLTLLVTCLILSITASGQNANEINLTNHEAEDRYASYSPDGSRILFESNRDGNWNIYSMTTDGMDLKLLTKDTADDRRPSWHPNGQKVLFESTRDGKNGLFVLDLIGDDIFKINIEEVSGEPIFGQYSNDGSKLAVSNRISGEKSNIKIIDENGKIIKTLADFGFRSFYPRWLPNDEKIVFFSRHETNNTDDEIYIINLDGSDKTRLTNWPKHNFCPAVSNDGSKIAYAVSMIDSRPEIYTMDIDRGNAQRITFNEDGDTLPNWSPDGKKLLVTGYRNGNYEIVEITLGKD